MSSPKKPEPNHSLPDSMRSRNPWPMWPIGLSIIIFIGVYTWINFEYRKDGDAFEPYKAMMDRKNAIVEKNFYDWYSIKTSRAPAPSDIASPASVTSRAYPDVLDKEVPEQLKYYMAGRPVLIPGFVKVESSATLTPGEALPFRLFVPPALADSDLLNILTFYKDGQLFVLVTLFVEKMEDFDAKLLDGEPVPTHFQMPTEPIAAETIDVHFLTEDRLAEWKIDNLDPGLATPEEEEE